MDPCPAPRVPTQAGAAARTLTLWQRVRSAVNFLEYKWGSSVVNYDSESQANIVSRTENSLSNTAMSTTGWVQQLKDFISAKLQKYADWANQANFYAVLVLLISVTIVALVVGTVVVLLLRLRLYRRARRRLGGVTGDVMGAMGEVATTAVLLTAAAALS